METPSSAYTDSPQVVDGAAPRALVPIIVTPPHPG